MEDADGNIRYFKKIATGSEVAEGGALQCVQDMYGNKLEFTLNDYGQPITVSVYPSGHTTPIRYLTLTYNSMGALTEIRNVVTGQVVTFLYGQS